MKAMILAAGLGTRMLPLTENLPKALIKIQEIPLLQHSILYLKYFGVKEIIVNVHHHAGQIIDFLKNNSNFGLRIAVSDEQDQLLDTGGGLYKARWFFDDDRPFFLTTSDVITDLNLISLYNYHLDHKPLATLAVKRRPSTREFIFDDQYNLCGWKNNISGETRFSRKTICSQQIAFSTIHVIDPALFELVTEKGSFSMTDLYLRLATDNIIKGFEHEKSDWFECGRIENLDKLNASHKIRQLYRHFHSIS